MAPLLLASAAFLAIILLILLRRRSITRVSSLESALNRSGVALVWIDLRNHTITRVNATFANLTGFQVHTFPENWIGDYLSVDQIMRLLTQVANGRVVDPIELTMRARERFPNVVISLSAIPLRKYKSALLVIRDLTEQKLVANRLLQSQKMEALGTLAGGVAHDFNNLLQVIQGYAEKISESVEDEDTAEAVKKVQLASIRASTLVSQLLTFSRRQQIQPRMIDVNTILMDMNAMLRPLLGSAVELVIVPAEGLPAIMVDLGQIESSLMNLVINAMHALAGKPGRISIESFAQWVDAEPEAAHIGARREDDCAPPRLLEGDYVVIRVTDNGCGIPHEVLPRIFEPFFTTKKIGKGTGLGLSTVYGAVKQNQGDVRVRSQVGEGTTFEILLPAHDRREMTPMTSDSEQVDLNGQERVLIIEDEPLIRTLLQETLQSRGYTVFCCGNGTEALRLDPEHVASFEVLITDLIMPHLGGVEVSIALREINPRLRTIFISGYTAEIAHIRSLSSSEAFLEKPFNDRVLCRTLRKLIVSSEPAVSVSSRLPTP